MLVRPRRMTRIGNILLTYALSRLDKSRARDSIDGDSERCGTSFRMRTTRIPEVTHGGGSDRERSRTRGYDFGGNAIGREPHLSAARTIRTPAAACRSGDPGTVSPDTCGERLGTGSRRA